MNSYSCYTCSAESPAVASGYHAKDNFSPECTVEILPTPPDSAEWAKGILAFSCF